ncbi:MAG: CAP domain-containing protein [Planctomycetota bacterium]
MRRHASLLVGLAASVLLAGARGGAAVYEAPHPEPTPEETLMLEFMNRLRADPVADMERIAPEGGPARALRWVKVDWEMFRSEMRKLEAAPPLVFDLDLLEAARKHSHYMILNELTHVEDPAKPGFTGRSFGDRVKAAGHAGRGGGENCYRDAANPWACHAGFTIDFGKGGPGGMQPGRGHRTNMMRAGFTTVGIGSIPHGGRISVTHNFGRGGTRCAGGVVYVDLNGNGFYDIGEGRGGVRITVSDGTSATTWASGAYVVRLKGKGPLEFTARLGELTFSETKGEGDANVKFDWIVPQQAALDLADGLIARVEAAKDGKKRFKEVVALWLGTRGLGLDPARTAKVDDLAKDVGPELDRHLDAVRAALKDFDAKTFDKTVRKHQKPYRYTAADGWFKEALLIGKATRMVEAYEKQAERAHASAVGRTGRQLVKMLEATARGLTHAEFRAKTEALVSRAKKLAGGR